MQVVAQFSGRVATGIGRYLPDPLVIAILLTVITVILGAGLTSATPVQMLTAWGDGLSSLLAFMAQISLTLLSAFALAHTDAVRRGLARLGAIPRSAVQAYVLVVVIAGAVSLILWALGLIAGGIVAREMAKQGRARGLKLHYPLLVAAAYGGFVIWHMGYSASAPLFVATPGNKMETLMGGVIPVQETIFAGWNMAIAAVTLLAVAVVCAIMHPREVLIEEISPESNTRDVKTKAEPESAELRPADQLDHNRWVSLLLGGGLAVYVGHWFITQGLALNLNIVNWSFLAAGLLLSRSPHHFVQLISEGARTAAPVLLQYPFYAGIMGLMLNTGLVEVIAQWFTQFASSQTLPFWAFLSGGLINYFIPSGGAQWAVQGPIFVEAAKNLDVELPMIVMGVAYGDQWSNMIQPFTMLPLLAVTGLQLRQVMGYSLVVFLVTFFTLGGGLLWVAS